jgi:hypothetical protein
MFGTGGLLGTGIGAAPLLGATTGTADLLAQAGSGNILKQLTSGLGAGGSNPFGAIFTGMTSGSEVQLTGTQRAGVAASTGAALAVGTYKAIQDFSRGGASGGLSGASDVLGMASMIPGPQQPFVAAAAMVTGMIGSMMGTGPQQRSKDLFNALSSAQYLAPTALNVTQGMGGTYEDFDARGNLRTSTLSAVPTVAEPYVTSRVVNGVRTYYDVPGSQTSPYGGGATGTGQTPVSNAPTTIINISAVDSQSFHDSLQRNHNAVGEAVATHLQSHEGRLSNAIRYVAQ